MMLAADHYSHYCALSGDAALPPPPHATRRATERDVPALARLYVDAGEMSRDQHAIRFCLTHNRIFVTEVGGQIVSAALTNAETPTMAMVGGVFTPTPLRNRGYASAAMAALCTSLLEEGIQPCLFYDNPAAGTIVLSHTHYTPSEPPSQLPMNRLTRQKRYSIIKQKGEAMKKE